MRIPIVLVAACDAAFTNFSDAVRRGKERRKILFVQQTQEDEDSAGSSIGESEHGGFGLVTLTVAANGDLTEALELVLVKQHRTFHVVVVHVRDVHTCCVLGEYMMHHDSDIVKVARLHSVALLCCDEIIRGQMWRGHNSSNSWQELLVMCDTLIVAPSTAEKSNNEALTLSLKVLKRVVAARNPSARLIWCTSLAEQFDLSTLEQRIEPEQLASAQTQRDEAMEPVNGWHTQVQVLLLESPDPMSVTRVQQFISQLLADADGNILRVWGVINLCGEPCMYNVQAMGYECNGALTAAWKPDNGKRVSKLICVGYDMDVPELQASFYECRAKPNLRFAVGDRVTANVGEASQCGVVTKQWDEGHAYRIVLDDGTDIWAPEDDDQFVVNA